MTIAIIIIVSLSNIICLFIGAKIGQKTAKGKDIKIPSPARNVREYKEDKESKHQRTEIMTMLENIESYNGTGLGQKDI